jgi:hypothetical protein
MLSYLYLGLRLRFLSLKLNLYYFLYDIKEKVYKNIRNDMDSLNNDLRRWYYGF